MFWYLRHFFTPHSGNNHRAKLLHHSSIISIIAAIFVLQFILSFVKTSYTNVLGTSTNISVGQLLLLTNQKRIAYGLKPLVLEKHLLVAANKKANYMFAKDFWAHTAPDGTTPWYFFRQAGYDYVYAGENLARGFSTSQEVIDAWMNSPTHRENMLSPNYDEIGFSITEGNLTGEQTTLVVETFGRESAAMLASSAKGSTQDQFSIQELSTTQLPQANSYLGVSVQKNPLIDTTVLSRNVGIVIVSLFISALLIDMVIVKRKKVYRFVGHNLDHIFFMSFILLFIVVSGIGSIR
jgi:hypothetical protein